MIGVSPEQVGDVDGPLSFRDQLIAQVARLTAERDDARAALDYLFHARAPWNHIIGRQWRYMRLSAAELVAANALTRAGILFQPDPSLDQFERTKGLAA